MDPYFYKLHSLWYPVILRLNEYHFFSTKQCLHLLIVLFITLVPFCCGFDKGLCKFLLLITK